MSRLPSLARVGWLRTPPIRRVFAALREAGGEGRVAGGAVRNALLKIPVADIDIATTLTPEQVTAACLRAGMAVHPTGIDHGTVTVVANHHPFEVTTLRLDMETDGRHAKIQYTDDWEADAFRRDFTMNALYCDERGKIYDYTNGYEDTLRKRIRFVGDAEQRIREDYLRILRFFRFHARFGVGAPDRCSLAACVAMAEGLDRLSVERIRQEMFKLMAAPGAVGTLKLMARKGILGKIILHTDDWRVIGRLPPDPVLRLAVLAREPETMKRQWRLSNEEAHRIGVIQSGVPPTPTLRPREQRIILYQTGADAWRDLVTVAWARSAAPMDDARWKRLLRLPVRWPVPRLPVTGRDLLDRGVPPGPEIGAALRALEDWWVASDFRPGKEDLLKRIS